MPRDAIAPVTCTVTAGQTLSAEIDLGKDGASLFGLIVPAIATNTTVNIQVASASGGTYYNLRLSDLSGDWQLASAVESIGVFVPDLSPFRYAKILLGATQAADVVFTFVGRE